MLTGTGAFDLSDVALQIRWSFNFSVLFVRYVFGKKRFDNVIMEISCISGLNQFLTDSNWQDL